MTVEINKIEAIIFDLGGVIINLDINATIEAFSALSNKSKAEIVEAYEKAEFFKEYEIGAISDAEFRQAIRHELNIQATDDQIDVAWNAMLKDIPISRIKAFESLRMKYKLFVMSNTNHIHIRKFNEIFDELNSGKSFVDHFDKVYFSQEIGVRKPNANAWTPILEDFNLAPEKALFIDDRSDNIEAAEKLGLKTFHNQQLNDWLAILK